MTDPNFTGPPPAAEEQGGAELPGAFGGLSQAIAGAYGGARVESQSQGPSPYPPPSAALPPMMALTDENQMNAMAQMNPMYMPQAAGFDMSIPSAALSGHRSAAALPLPVPMHSHSQAHYFVDANGQPSHGHHFQQMYAPPPPSGVPESGGAPMVAMHGYAPHSEMHMQQIMDPRFASAIYSQMAAVPTMTTQPMAAATVDTTNTGNPTVLGDSSISMVAPEIADAAVVTLSADDTTHATDIGAGDDPRMYDDNNLFSDSEQSEDVHTGADDEEEDDDDVEEEEDDVGDENRQRQTHAADGSVLRETVVEETEEESTKMQVDESTEELGLSEVHVVNDSSEENAEVEDEEENDEEAYHSAEESEEQSESEGDIKKEKRKKKSRKRKRKAMDFESELEKGTELTVTATEDVPMSSAAPSAKKPQLPGGRRMRVDSQKSESFLEHSFDYESLHILKLGPGIGVAPNGYDADTYDKAEMRRDKGNEFVMRWRERVQSDGRRVAESNSRLVEWSDGSFSLAIGGHYFDVDIRSDAKSNEYLYATDTKPLYECHGRVDSKMSAQKAFEVSTELAQKLGAFAKTSKSKTKIR